MKKIVLIILLLILSSNAILSQEKKSNPILYSELVLGCSGGSANGFTLGGTLNYQREKSLFSFRYINQTVVKFEGVVVGFVGFPVITKELSLNEFSALYGRRKIRKGQSLSYSLGVSISQTDFEKSQPSNKTFVGLPFEFNIKWFKKEKKRFRAYYGLIPLGKPTSFGRSFGFKLYGNFGKLSHVGIGVNYGFGWHKRY